MRGGRFGTGMNTFMSVHRQTLEADYAAHARQRARATENAMRLAAPSDALGNGKLAAAMVRDIYSLGRGVAFRIESPDLLAVRARIAGRFHGLLTAQDRGTLRLHITIQNKAVPGEARALRDALAGGFRPRALTITGLAAHLYRGGPWELLFKRNFRGPRT